MSTYTVRRLASDSKRYRTPVKPVQDRAVGEQATPDQAATADHTPPATTHSISRPGTGAAFESAAMLGAFDRVDQDVLVIGNTVWKLVPWATEDGDRWVIYGRGHKRAVRYCGQLSRRIAALCDIAEPGYDHRVLLDLPPIRPPAQVRAVETFVNTVLIPRLQRGRAAVAPRWGDGGLDNDTVATERETSTDPKWVRETLAEFKGMFLLSGSSYYRLKPFEGEPRNRQIYLGWKSQGKTLGFLGVEKQSRYQALARFDQLLSEMRRRIQASVVRNLDQHLVYQDRRHLIYRLPGDHYYLCTRIPPYGVQGPEGEIQLMRKTMVGIEISTTKVDDVIYPGAAKVMTLGDKPLVVSGWDAPGTPVEMPIQAGSYLELYALPTEEALLRYLESARLTVTGNLRIGPLPGDPTQRLALPLQKRPTVGKHPVLDPVPESMTPDTDSPGQEGEGEEWLEEANRSGKLIDLQGVVELRARQAADLHELNDLFGEFFPSSPRPPGRVLMFPGVGGIK